MANDINGELRNVLPGNIDYWNRVYATVADANAAIPSTVVGSRNFREGKVVQIGTVTDHKEYRWMGGFADTDLQEYLGDVTKLSEQIYQSYSIGPTDFTADTAGSQTLNRCIVNQRKFATEPGKAVFFKIKTSANIASIRRLVQFRKTGVNYTVVGSVNVNLLGGVESINISSSNLNVEIGDIFGVQNISVESSFRSNVLPGSNESTISIDPVDGVLTLRDDQANGDTGNDTVFLYSVEIETNKINSFTESIQVIETNISYVESELNTQKTDLSTISQQTQQNTGLINSEKTNISDIGLIIGEYKDLESYKISGGAGSGWTGTGFSGWSVGFTFNDVSRSFYAISLSLSQVSLNDSIDFKIYTRPISESNSNVFPGLSANDVLIRSKSVLASSFVATTAVQTCRFEFDEVPKNTQFIYLVSVKGIKNGGIGTLGSDQGASTANTLKQYQAGWYNSAPAGTNSLVPLNIAFRVPIVVYEKKIESTIEGVKAAAESILVTQDKKIYSIPATSDAGFAGTTFVSWAIGFNFAQSGGTFYKIKKSLSRIPSNHHLRVRLYRRPIANIDLAGSPASYPGNTGTGDVILQEYTVPSSQFANTPDLQDCFFEFTPVEISNQYIYILFVRGELEGNTDGILGSSRTSATPGSLKQHELGWYRSTGGTNASISTTTSAYRLDVEVFESETVSRIPIIEQSVSGLSAEVQEIQQQIGSIGSRLTNGTGLFSDNFTSISSDWIANGWSTVAGGVTPGSTGFAGALRLNKQYSLDKRNVSSRVKFGSDNRLMLHTLSQESNNTLATLGEFDIPAGQLRIYKAFDGSTLPVVSVSMPYAFNAAREYLIELGIDKNSFKHILKITDLFTGIPTTLEDTTKAAGRQHDNYAITLYSGVNKPIVRSFNVWTPYKEVFATVDGDSISEAMGNSVTVVNGYAQRYQSYVASLGGQVAVSGRGGGGIAGVIRRIDTECAFLKPAYVIVTIGTNAGNNISLLRELVNKIIAIGAIPVLNNIPMRGDQDVTSRNVDIATVRTEFGITGARFDVATALNYDITQGYDPAKFYGDLVHPIDFGNPFIYNMMPIDTPQLFK